MDGYQEYPLICRACLKMVENRTQCFGFIEDATGNLKDMLMCCIPEMDIYITANPILCFPCIQQLVFVYNFKTKCLNTETIIRTYIERNNLSDQSQVNLHCVIQELIKFNNYYKDAPPRPIQDANQIRNHQNPTGMPCGVPQGTHFLLTRNMDREIVKFNHCQGTAEHQRSLQTNVTQKEDQTLQKSQENAVVSNCDSTWNQNRLDEEAIETNNKSDVEAPEGLQSIVENHSDKSKNESEPMQTHRSEILFDQTIYVHPEKKSVSSETDNNLPLQEELQKQCVEQNRPRLIIRISKNKISMPENIILDKNEDSNEKENQDNEHEINEMEFSPPEITPLGPDQELYQCSKCTFITTHLTSYETHRTDCHPDAKKCPHCPHITSRQRDLEKHINTIHTKSTWYFCEYCPYRSTDSSCLTRHRRKSHTESRPTDFVCQLCPFRTASNYLFKKHMLRHDGESVLHCQFCPYSTTDRSNFRKHVFVHNPKSHNCKFCDYKCGSPYQMKLHLKKLHNGIGMDEIDCKSEVSIMEVMQDISAAINEEKRHKGYEID